MLNLSRANAAPITKILVANRGEIACRVFRTAKALGVKTVAVHCDAEKNGKHVQSADEAFRIGAPPAATSYLRGENIIEVAKKCGADAIHPGYGFLSENAEFAEAVQKAGIEWVGPPASAIVAMGSKSESKNIMIKANVPVVPGYHAEAQDDATLTAEAQRVGFPLLIKAVSGGGGKGMKIVRSMDEFPTLLASARREAINFFKDDRVLLERYIESPRHVECQVFCDKHGNGVFFFERDCSVQRRYQKVLEEAPAPHLSEELRQRIGSVAVAAAKAVNYVGAGTVEFIFDTDANDFYFMEMNTRLQVEHPVTEEVVLVKGEPLDLVKLQIDVAEGKPLPFTQEDLRLNGHCIEARIFAESPRDGFLPGSGHLSFVAEPVPGARGGNVRVRVDTGFRSGDDVLVHYDPMIAKLIVWGPDREAALKGLRRALDEYHIVGIPTNIEFLKKCCDNDAFAKGGVTTKFIEEHKESLLKADALPTNVLALAAVEALLASGAAGAECAPLRLHSSPKHSVSFIPEGTKEPVTMDVEVLTSSLGPTTYAVTNPATGVRHTVAPCPALDSTAKAARLDDGTIGAPRIEYGVVRAGGHLALRLPQHGGCFAFRFPVPLPRGFGDVRAATGPAGQATLLAPMPGKVGKLLVAPGTVVAAGQAVMIVEAMKMEHLIKAPGAGVVTFQVAEGDMCAADQQIATITPEKK